MAFLPYLGTTLNTDPIPSPPLVKKTILVTFADSYLGHTIARTLALDTSIKVRITASRQDAVKDLEQLGCEFKLLQNHPDRIHTGLLDDIYFNVSTVVLIPQLIHPQFDELVALHLAAFNRSMNNIKSIVFLSNIRGSKRFPTSWTTLNTCENLVASNPSPNTILRLGFIQQNLIGLSELISERATLALPIGVDVKMNMVSIKDVAIAVRSLLPGGRRFDMLKRQNVFTLTGTQNVDGNELANLASSVLGFEIKYMYIKDSVMRQILKAIPGHTDTEIEAYMAMYQDIRDGIHNKISGDLAYLLPRAPTSLKQFFTDNINQFRPN